MRVTVCEFPDEQSLQGRAWAQLVEYCQVVRTDMVVLPEMPFCDWKIFTSRDVDLEQWRAAVASHDTQIARFGELSGAAVLSSRPIEIVGKRMNQSFAWTTADGYVGAHSKHYLPDEPDGWEATWFDQGDLDSPPIEVNGIRVGFQICTELLFSEMSRRLGRDGAHLIGAPRATSGHRRWPLAARMAAVMAGSFVASANRRSSDDGGFAGGSWLVSPEAEVLAATSAKEPFVTAEIDPADAEAAKRTYPRNLQRDGHGSER